MPTWRVLRPFDPWKSPKCTCPMKYTINPYTGCSLFCHYCYATSYIGRRPSEPKKDLLKKLRLDLKQADLSIPIDISLSSDPYPPIERKYELTRSILKELVKKGFKVQITTKSDLVVRDIDILAEGGMAVSMTITTLDDNLAKKMEPGAPPPSKRLKALEKIVENGIPASVRADPIVPYLNDNEEEIYDLIDTLASIGVKHVVTSTYKARPDNFKRMIEVFPELEEKWRKLYYPKGKIKFSYAYLDIKIRKKLLEPVVNQARKRNLTYATCREDLTTEKFFKAPTCDGTHLIREIKKKKQREMNLSNSFKNLE